MSELQQTIVPKGSLVQLGVSDLRTSVANPRELFDREPLDALKGSIRLHGVLVPLTVYKLPAQNRFGILDGERRFRCCVELAEEGADISIPANVVSPPDAMASLIYMFNIHSFREQWELMPTAIGLQRIIDHLGGSPSDQELHELTGLSDPQIRRCRIILRFPRRFQELSLDPDPGKRIPSNFWIELSPVLELIKKYLPELVVSPGIDGLCDLLVEKYRARKIRSVVHFRRIVEAFDGTDDKDEIARVSDRLREYVLTVGLETRAAFDEFIVDQRRKQKVAEACGRFIADIQRSRVENISETEDRKELLDQLMQVVEVVTDLIERLQVSDPPDATDQESE